VIDQTQPTLLKSKPLKKSIEYKGFRCGESFWIALGTLFRLVRRELVFPLLIFARKSNIQPVYTSVDTGFTVHSLPYLLKAENRLL
jgi:hypothetical protein